MGRPLRRVPGLGQPSSEVGAVDGAHHGRGARSTAPAVPIGEVDAAPRRGPAAPACGEFDRVLGGGLVPGAWSCGRRARRRQVDPAARRRRPGRPGRRGPHRALRQRRGVGRPGAAARRAHRARWPRPALPRRRDRPRRRPRPDRGQVEPDLLVVDSVQTIASAEVEGVAGDVTQVREVAAALIQVAKARGIAIAPRRPRHQGRLDRRPAGARAPRRRRACSSRATGTPGCAWCARSRTASAPPTRSAASTCSDVGIVGLPDPSGLFLSRRAPQPVPGHLRHGHPRGPAARWSTEVQALVAPSDARHARGAPPAGSTPSRVAMILAVLDQRAGAPLGEPRRLRSPPSAGCGSPSRPPTSRSRWPWPAPSRDRPLPPGTIAFGEVGLAGELRRVTGDPPPARRGGPARLHARPSCRRRVAVGGPVPTASEVVEVADVAASASRRLRQPSACDVRARTGRPLHRLDCGRPSRARPRPTARPGTRWTRPTQRRRAAARHPRRRRARAPSCATASSASCAAAPAP